MLKEWEVYLTNLALERIKENFSGQSMEVFERSLQGQSVELIASELGLKENSVYRLKNRVKDRLISEVQQLRHDLE